jgi:hypothetical protein
MVFALMLANPKKHKAEESRLTVKSEDVLAQSACLITSEPLPYDKLDGMRGV